MRLHRLIVPLVAAAVLVPLSATTADAAPAIRLTYAQYDSPGDDLPTTNVKLNAEWVRVKNFSTVTRNLSGWRILDATGHRYIFPTGSKLGPGKSVSVHTGTGTDGPLGVHKYWRSSYYVWNNTGDTARLRNPAGTLIDSCNWGDGDGTTAC